MQTVDFDLPVQTLLGRLHRQLLGHDEGAVADYIPELAKVDPNLFGIALVSVDGSVYQVGDSQHGFTIQSISKPLTFALALQDQGVERVGGFVGVEPTGDAFNSISLEPDSGRPLNPMINAGAIATAGLVTGQSVEHRFRRVLDCYGRCAGRELVLNEAVYQSEKTTGHRNRAISHLLRNFDMLEGNPELHLDLYFRQCSIELSCRDLAVIAATLANYGVNPITGVDVIPRKYSEKVLSVMATCGMYDYSGTWIYDVGLPAKSGVGGGIMAVLPGQFGLAIFSPRLDRKGNSVRGIRVCEELSRSLRMHIFHGRPGNPTAVRLQYDAAEVSSRRDWPAEVAGLIEAHGKSIRIFELHGGLDFATAEHLTREVALVLSGTRHIILDLRRVMDIDLAASHLLADLYEKLLKQDTILVFTQLGRHFRFRQFLLRRLSDGDPQRLREFTDVDQALEWCESQLVITLEEGWVWRRLPELKDMELLQDFDEEELDAIEESTETVKFPRGETILRENTLDEKTADCLYFITEGVVSVNMSLGRTQVRRLARLGAGSNFGEMSLLDQQRRSASVVAETEVTCRVLAYRVLNNLTPELAARIQSKLVRNLGRQLSRKLRRANQEIRALS